MDWHSKRRKVDNLLDEFKRRKGREREHYFDTQIRAHFEERIKKISPGLRGKPEDIQEKLWGDDGIVKRAFRKKEDTRHGALGELEFLERKILIEKVPVEVLPEKQNVKLEGSNSNEKNPDFKLILKEKGKEELVTEVKTPVSDNIRRAKTLVENANVQLKKSSLETEHSLPDEFKKFPGRAQGSLEIQYNDKHVSTLDKAGLEKTEEKIREAFSPAKHRGVVQVRVYRDHQLVLELQRNRQNQIIKTHPMREQVKEWEGPDSLPNQRSKRDDLKKAMLQTKEDSKENFKEVQRILNPGRRR